MRFMNIVGLAAILVVAGAGIASAKHHTAKATAKAHALGGDTAITITDINSVVDEDGAQSSSFGAASTSRGGSNGGSASSN
jgi:hypothetical protein